MITTLQRPSKLIAGAGLGGGAVLAFGGFADAASVVARTSAMAREIGRSGR
jgi:hypothetical protein